MSEKTIKSKVKLSAIDTDIHNELPSYNSLDPYLSKRWKEHRHSIGDRGYDAYSIGAPYPTGSPLASRADAWPSSGLRPGSDFEFMKEQLLDAYDFEYGILNCLYPVGSQLNDRYATALARAINDWQIEEWLEKDSRLRASIVIPYENAKYSVQEIKRLAEHPGFVQILILSRTNEPLGRRKYWEIYKTAEDYGLPIGVHAINKATHPITSSGWLSHYLEIHTTLAPSAQAQVVSLVYEGVFEQFPHLKFSMIEMGFAWLPSLMWRMDKQWKRLKAEVPYLKRLPSEYILENMKFTTQPMEEPTYPRQFYKLLEHLGNDEMLMFATDYPHWDFDEPTRAFPIRLSKEIERKILYENAINFYNFEKR